MGERKDPATSLFRVALLGRVITESTMASDPARRTFLGASLCGLLAVSLPWTAGASAIGRDPRPETLRWLFRVTGERDAVIHVGHRYLRAYPGEQDVTRLLAAVRASLIGQLGGVEPDFSVGSSLAVAVRDLVSGEYRRGELASVDGWLLSRTEARVYAAAALLHGMP
jgi:hypothetical protein